MTLELRKPGLACVICWTYLKDTQASPGNGCCLGAGDMHGPSKDCFVASLAKEKPSVLFQTLQLILVCTA